MKSLVGWTAWKEESTCSTSCGGGIKLLERKCALLENGTVMQNWLCEGAYRSFDKCNTHECPG